MVGQLGEESMLVGLWDKIRHAGTGLSRGGRPKVRIPDLNISFLGQIAIGEVKFLRTLRGSGQIRDFARIAFDQASDKTLRLFYPNTYTNPESVKAFVNWTLNPRNPIDNISLHSIEEYVGLRAATEINVTCQFGQGVNHYFSGWGG